MKPTEPMGRRPRRSTLCGALLALILAALAVPALAAPPEVTALDWCPGQTDCLKWTTTPGAVKYRLYRGEHATLPCAHSTSLDSCDDGLYTTTTTGGTIVEVPVAGSMFWYLVTGIDAFGEGPPGSGTIGPRTLNLTGPCAVVCSPVGTTCGSNSDCCTNDCNGTCQANCCTLVGDACQIDADCCSGNCTAGICQSQCSQPTDCPGSDTECATRTCNAGVCGFSYAPSGTPTGTQVAGDCATKVCDGAGSIVNQVDNADVPVDNLQCTNDTCTNGVPSNPPAPVNFPCAQDGGVVCNGFGQCVECTVAAQCPGTDTQCQSRACTSYTCGFSYAPNGAPCSEGGGNVCNGAGSCVNAPQVVSTTPADGSSALASTLIAVTFSQAMNPLTLTGQTAAGACSGSIQVSLDDFASCVAFASGAPAMSGGDTLATLTPAPGLLVNRTFKIRVTTAAQNSTGIPLAAQYTHATGFTTQSPNLCDGSLVISQVYGFGGLSGAVYRNDFVELHNRGSAAASVAGMSIQYASSSGTTWLRTNLAGSIPAGGYYLIQLFSGGANGALLPTPDATGTTDISGANGKLALVSNQTTLSGSCPTGGAILDFVGYGSANCNEGGSNAPAGTVSTAVLRQQSGCADLNANGLDFVTAAPVARNTASTPLVCACVARNESNTAAEADFCAVVFPLSLAAQAGTAVAPIFGQIYEAGVTEPPGAASSVRAQVGYGPASVNPEYQPGWSWFSASYNVQVGNNDEYQASFTAPAVGSYGYVYRFSLDAGVSWTYCDTNQADGGSGSNAGLTFDFANEGVLTTTP